MAHINNGGTAEITTGINAVGDWIMLANGAGQSGRLSVSGGSLTLTNELVVGNQGLGVFDLSGGSVVNAIGNIGRDFGSIGTVSVTGGTWTNSSLLVIGNQGSGALTLGGTGVIDAPTVDLGRQGGGSGVLNLNGGTLSAGNLVEGGGSGKVNFNGGTLRLTGNQAALFSGFESGDLVLQGGGLFLNTNDFSVKLFWSATPAPEASPSAAHAQYPGPGRFRNGHLPALRLYRRLDRQRFAFWHRARSL